MNSKTSRLNKEKSQRQKKNLFSSSGQAGFCKRDDYLQSFLAQFSIASKCSYLAERGEPDDPSCSIIPSPHPPNSIYRPSQAYQLPNNWTSVSGTRFATIASPQSRQTNAQPNETARIHEIQMQLSTASWLMFGRSASLLYLAWPAQYAPISRLPPILPSFHEGIEARGGRGFYKALPTMSSLRLRAFFINLFLDVRRHLPSSFYLGSVFDWKVCRCSESEKRVLCAATHLPPRIWCSVHKWTWALWVPHSS